jgi:hypothetical protein
MIAREDGAFSDASLAPSRRATAGMRRPQSQAYAELGITMTYKPADDTVVVEARPACAYERVGGTIRLVGILTVRASISLVCRVVTDR